MECDIFQINDKILEYFENRDSNLEIYTKKLENLKKILKTGNVSINTQSRLKNECVNLEELIDDISKNRSYNFYIMESSKFISDYKIHLKNPVELSFMGKKKTSDSFSQKNAIISQYLKIAKKYTEFVPLDFNKFVVKKTETHSIPKIICENCQSKKFDIVDSNYICTKCGGIFEMLHHFSSYKDTERVNITTKYTYDPKIHFRDCINQFQGKQNATVDAQIYKNLIEQFDLHRLLIGTPKTPKEERFKKITKDHIYLFLKDTGNSKHYEDLTLIHYNLTGVKPDDISQLEPSLMQDFDILTNLYDQIYRKDRKIERKNFINTQYVLFQLLRRHKYPCRKEDFNILKTTDRQSFHDDICKTLFEKLGWNFTAIF